MSAPTKDNTLYLPIKQVYFDQIIAGTKKEEYREVKIGITANRYLQKNEDGSYVLNPECTTPGTEYYVDDYNDGHFPFMPKRYEYLHLVVGYNKVRDEALVEVSDISFEPTRVRGTGKMKFTFWIIAYHLGKVVSLERQKHHD